MTNITGGWIPALMWKEFMVKAMEGVSRIDFPRPRRMVQRKVNWLTGNLATEYSPEQYVSLEKFWQGREPVAEDGPSSQSVGDRITDPQSNSSGSGLLDFFR